MLAAVRKSLSRRHCNCKLACASCSRPDHSCGRKNMNAAKPYRVCGVRTAERWHARKQWPECLPSVQSWVQTPRASANQLQRLRPAVGGCLLQQPIVQPTARSVRCTSRIKLPRSA